MPRPVPQQKGRSWRAAARGRRLPALGQEWVTCVRKLVNLTEKLASQCTSKSKQSQAAWTPASALQSYDPTPRCKRAPRAPSQNAIAHAGGLDIRIRQSSARLQSAFSSRPTPSILSAACGTRVAHRSAKDCPSICVTVAPEV